jgi:hypothetical protein
MSELEGAALDEAVAVALGESTLVRDADTGRPLYRVPSWMDCPSEDPDYGEDFEPSRRWDHGGPLIERELIETHARRFLDGTLKEWAAAAKGPDGIYDWYGVGPTPLVAAMRAFVASREKP